MHCCYRGRRRPDDGCSLSRGPIRRHGGSGRSADGIADADHPEPRSGGAPARSGGHTGDETGKPDTQIACWSYFVTSFNFAKREPSDLALLAILVGAVHIERVELIISCRATPCFQRIPRSYSPVVSER